MDVDSNKEYSVNWKNHMSHVRKAFDQLLTSSEFTDVTLCCEGKKIGAHKMLLAACSGYFRDIFKELPSQHPVIILYGVEYHVLSDILHFIYNGEVSVDTSKLDTFLKVAQILQISGLTEDPEIADSTVSNSQSVSNEVKNIIQTNDSAASSNEDVRRPVKRARTGETEVKDKVLQQQNDAVFISDVKCEPSEFVSFEEHLEDPLQPDEGQEQKMFFDHDMNHHIVIEDDIKTQTNSTKNSWPLNTVKCNICDKVFSHPYSLQQHKPVHAGNTRCPICNAVLSRKYHLKLHMKARHNLN